MIFLYFEILRYNLFGFSGFSESLNTQNVAYCVSVTTAHFHALVNSGELLVATRRDERLILARGWPFFNFLSVASVASCARAPVGPVHVCCALFCRASTMNEVFSKLRRIESLRVARASFPEIGSDITDIGWNVETRTTIKHIPGNL